MGTDLIIISNHNVDYASFDFDRLGREVAARLNQTRLENLEFYWLSRLIRDGVEPAEIQQYNMVEMTRPWHHNADYYDRAGFYADDWRRGTICFDGPFGWEILLWPGQASIDLYPFRYLSWVHGNEDDPNNEFRRAYRKALALLVRSLGGDEATYLADNSHTLTEFTEIDGYDTMRHALAAKLGPPLRTFAEMEAWRKHLLSDKTYPKDRAYWVDDFSDLDWSAPIQLSPWLREFRDKTGLPSLV